MAKKRRPDPAEQLRRREEIKKLVIMALFSDDALMERLVVKGGNALGLIHGVGSRESVDVDVSIDGDFTSEEFTTLKSRIHKALQDTFQLHDLRVFDAELTQRPENLSSDLEEFWGGYLVQFKLIGREEFERLRDDIDALRRNAIQLGEGSKFSVDISKHEYTHGKTKAILDGLVVYVYTPEMIVCEKLRAICQQMREYGPTIKRKRAGSSRAKDFVDIYAILDELNLGFGTKSHRKLLAKVFESKRVELSLLRRVDLYREFHRGTYPAVEATVRAGVELKGFDFYFDFVLGLIRRLEPLGDE